MYGSRTDTPNTNPSKRIAIPGEQLGQNSPILLVVYIYAIPYITQDSPTSPQYTLIEEELNSSLGSVIIEGLGAEFGTIEQSYKIGDDREGIAGFLAEYGQLYPILKEAPQKIYNQ